MNVHSHRHFLAGRKNFGAGFTALLLETYTGRQVIHGARLWGSIQWATPTTSADGADDQDGQMGLFVMWGNPPPAPTNFAPAAGIVIASLDLMSAAEGIGPMFNNASNAVGARQDTPLPTHGTRCKATPSGQDVAMYFGWLFTLTFGVGTYRGMSAWTESEWNRVPW